MTFLEAMALIKAHPAGLGAKAVGRPGEEQFIFCLPPKTDAAGPLMAGWKAHGRKSNTHSAVICIKDIEATDWEEVVL